MEQQIEISGNAAAGDDALPKERGASSMLAEELPQLWASERAQLFDEVEVCSACCVANGCAAEQTDFHPTSRTDFHLDGARLAR